jgi:uncharacterized protein with PQ loop repeat
MLFVVFNYPSKYKTDASKKVFFIKQKVCNFILPLCAAFIFITWVNNISKANTTGVVFGSNIIKPSEAQKILESGKTKESLSGKEKRILKKEFFKQLKNYLISPVNSDNPKSEKALSIMFAIILLIGLSALLAYLVCNLSCSGYEAAAGLITVFGLIGIIGGFVLLLKAITRKYKKTVALKNNM